MKGKFIFLMSLVSISLMFAASDEMAAGALSTWVGELCNDSWFADAHTTQHLATGLLFSAPITLLGWGIRWGAWQARKPNYAEL